MEDTSTAKLPVFRADSIEAIEAAKDFEISSYYCMDHTTARNHYVIDENQVLWGYGHNGFGQLGNGQFSLGMTLSQRLPFIIRRQVS